MTMLVEEFSLWWEPFTREPGIGRMAEPSEKSLEKQSLDACNEPIRSTEMRIYEWKFKKGLEVILHEKDEEWLAVFK